MSFSVRTNDTNALGLTNACLAGAGPARVGVQRGPWKRPKEMQGRLELASPTLLQVLSSILPADPS